MDFWAEAKRLSYVTSDDDFRRLVAALGFRIPAGTTREQFRDRYRDAICDPDGWPRAFPVITGGKVAEGITVHSLSGQILGKTTGNRRRCSATSTRCPGWFIEVVWETGQRMWPCSEGWHYGDGEISIIGGGEISARFVSPKPLGTQPLPRSDWPSKKDLSGMRGWRVRT